MPMLNTDKIQALLFDFGGTIDTGGLHWVHILYPLWEARHPGLDPSLYSRAFAHGERSLAQKKIIQKEDNFLDLLEKKLAIQAAYLNQHGLPCTIMDQKSIADQAYQEASYNCQQHAVILKMLGQKYRIAMVSNFYGNLHTVLKDFGILPLFETITESAVVGVKKPDPRIWQLGADSLHLPTDRVVAIGDALTKDMIPATSIGCQGIWIQGKGWEEAPGSAGTGDQSQYEESVNKYQLIPIKSLSQLPELLLSEK
jgi:putative hydrolase of the HAD superfamily